MYGGPARKLPDCSDAHWQLALVGRRTSGSWQLSAHACRKLWQARWQGTAEHGGGWRLAWCASGSAQSSVPGPKPGPRAGRAQVENRTHAVGHGGGSGLTRAPPAPAVSAAPRLPPPSSTSGGVDPRARRRCPLPAPRPPPPKTAPATAPVAGKLSWLVRRRLAGGAEAAGGGLAGAGEGPGRSWAVVGICQPWLWLAADPLLELLELLEPA